MTLSTKLPHRPFCVANDWDLKGVMLIGRHKPFQNLLICDIKNGSVHPDVWTAFQLLQSTGLGRHNLCVFNLLTIFTYDLFNHVENAYTQSDLNLHACK